LHFHAIINLKFFQQDLKSWYPELADRIRITLIEALPSVLPMFSKQLIEYTGRLCHGHTQISDHPTLESTFRSSKINIRTGTMVKEVTPKSVVVDTKEKGKEEIPCGLLVWAGV
jgi:NADH:ubiquinone reductase (non-electrogenic)